MYGMGLSWRRASLNIFCLPQRLHVRTPSSCPASSRDGRSCNVLLRLHVVPPSRLYFLFRLTVLIGAHMTQMTRRRQEGRRRRRRR
jgi:hypothetical protein